MGIGFLGIFIAPIAGAVVLGMAIVVIGLGSVFLGVVKFPTFGLLYFKGNKVQEEFNSAMVKLEKFESYKKFLKNEESFNDFALKIDMQNLKRS
ncbi:MAG: hypothetical protein HWD61_07900 [Parachlamydiaceae bacterium]|nr:MAG: hypothetical protein HWD61_07900 [Parachlamydiaceae bacterium]